MLDSATYTPRLKAHYDNTVRAALKEEFGYKNDMQIPRLDKIVLNMGVGEAVEFEVRGRVPAGRLENDLGILVVSAIGGGPAALENRDRITVTGEAALALTKSVSNPSPRPGDALTFTVDGANVGNGPATGVPLVIDGAPASGVVVTDSIPAQTTFAGNLDAGSGVALYHVGGMAPQQFTTTAPADPSDVVMIGAAIRPRMNPAFRTLSPTGTSNSRMITGFMIDRPMNPQTTEGIAANISTNTLSTSRVRPRANSAM